jgi:Flp pilus assembly protein TadB
MPARQRGLLAGAIVLVWLMLLSGLSTWLYLSAPVVLIGAFWILGRFESSASRRRRQLLVDQLPEALDLMMVSVQAGQPLRNAVLLAVNGLPEPVAGLIGRVSQGIAVGLTEAEAWQALADEPMVADLAADLARSLNWGTSSAVVLSSYRRQWRRRSATSRLAAAKAVGVRTILPLGLCYLPAFMLLGVVPMVASGVIGLLG